MNYYYACEYNGRAGAPPSQGAMDSTQDAFLEAPSAEELEPMDGTEELAAEMTECLDEEKAEDPTKA